jgi:uncharacterized protein YcnI
MNRLLHIAVIAAVAASSLPAGAAAHVTLQPNEVPAGGFERLDVRVPNERDDASTKKVEVKFPAGFISVSHEPVAGWDAKVTMATLAAPVEMFGEQHTERVDTVTFSTDGAGIRPGRFQDFGLSVALPDEAGSTLTFKALQTYSDGEVVRWIGAPDTDAPAPQVKLTAAAAASPGAHGAPAAPAAASDGGEEDGDTLALVALIVGALGLLAGGAGLALARRARAIATA